MLTQEFDKKVTFLNFAFRLMLHTHTVKAITQMDKKITGFSIW